MADKSPMLAERKSIHLWPAKLRFPVFALPKLDGIRCVCASALAVSRSFIGIANDHVRESISRPDLEGLDGELIVGSPSAENVYNKTCAVNGNKVKVPEFSWQVFDDFSGSPELPYSVRQHRLRERLLEFSMADLYPFIRYVEPTLLETWADLERYEEGILGDGFEGVITRSPEGLYKFGRSTAKEQAMLKLKRFTDGEAEIIGFEELMHNTNPNIKDAFGHAKRSKAQDGLVSGGTLGKMQVRDIETGVEFQIGMFKGLTSPQKQEIWNERDSHLGSIVKYSHFAHGAIDKPRHSKFLGFRARTDM